MKILDYLLNDYGKHNEYLKTLFLQFPSDASVSLLRIPAGKAVIWQDDPCNMVYVLVEGRVRTIIHQHGKGDHAFSDFKAVELFGEYEVLADIKAYLADVRTCVDSKFIAITAADYLQWMHNDRQIFHSRVRVALQTLLYQNARERSSLYMNGGDRMKQFLLDYYFRNAVGDEPVIVMQTHASIGEEIGSSMRTVNRAISALHDKKLIHIIKGKIVITPAQFQLLKQEMNKQVV